MTKNCKTFGLLSKNKRDCLELLKSIYSFLIESGSKVLVEINVAKVLQNVEGFSLEHIGLNADIAIIIGGDGHMLGAARVFCKYPIKIIGVNKGKLGFLTDLSANAVLDDLKKVVAGNYTEESRFLLNISVIRDNVVKVQNLAMNEVVFHANQLAHMLIFDVYIDGCLMSNQRADGFIVATPTGSTAYSLSAGGAVLSPDLDVIILIPMFSHTLSSRPIVISSKSEVKLVVSVDDMRGKMVSCDGQVKFPVFSGDSIIINKHDQELNLIHTVDYNYFDVLRNKMHWNFR